MKTTVQFILTIMVFSALLISCKTSDSKVENPLLYFDLKEMPYKTTLKLSDLGATDIQYIPLETNEQSVIPRIQKIIRSKNCF